MRESRLGLRGHHPLRLPGHPAVRCGDPRRCGRQGRGLRAALLRHRHQGPPLQRLGDDRHRHPRPVPADPPPDRPPGSADVLPVLGTGGQAGDYDVLHHHRRAPWPVEETFKTGKDVLGWDQCQARTWDAACRHIALAALAQLRQVAIRNDLCGLLQLPPAASTPPACGSGDDDRDADDADLRIPLGDAPVPEPRRAAVPAAPRPDQAVRRRDRPADPARRPGRRRADEPRPARVRAAMVRPPAARPGHRPVASPQRPAPRRRRYLTPGNRKEVTACNHNQDSDTTVRDAVTSPRETATVILSKFLGDRKPDRRYVTRLLLQLL